MMGQKGASLQATRRIHRRLSAKLAEYRARLAAYRAAGRTGVCVELVEDLVRMAEAELSGGRPPVGVLKGVWEQVCDEARRAATTTNQETE